MTNLKIFLNAGRGLPKTRGRWSLHATTSYHQHKGNTIVPASDGGNAGAAIGKEGTAPPLAPAAPAKPVRTLAEWEASPGLHRAAHCALKPPKQVSVTEGGGI